MTEIRRVGTAQNVWQWQQQGGCFPISLVPRARVDAVGGGTAQGETVTNYLSKFLKVTQLENDGATIQIKVF